MPHANRTAATCANALAIMCGVDLAHVEALVPADAAGAWQEGDAWLAGGTWLFSEPQPTLRRLVDLRAFGWPALTVSEAGLELAATCTVGELASWSPPPAWGAARALVGPCCEALLASFKVRHEATVGGNLCLALPAGAMTSLAVALDATLELWSGPDPDGSAARELPAVALATGPTANALAPGELLRAIRIPAAALAARVALRRHSLSVLGRSGVLVIGRRDAAGGFVLSVTAAVPAPVERRFASLPTADDLQASLDGVAWYDDVHGDPAWREAMTRRSAEQIRQELGG